MQSRCNDTRVSVGYEIMRSVTASEIFTRTGKECVAIKLPNMIFGLDLLLSLSNWA